MYNSFAGKLVLAVIAVVISVSTAMAEDGIHIEGDSVSSFPWKNTDGSGFDWAITQSGAVSDGGSAAANLSDAYDAGMNIVVDGRSFGAFGAATTHKKYKELELGQLSFNQVSFSRRIYISQDKGNGYCRWIDIFENIGNEDANFEVRYDTNMGPCARTILTTSQEQKVTEKDWGVITYDKETEKPAIIHIFASPDAKVRPTVNLRANSDNVGYTFSLTVPAGKAAAICLFEIQRKDMDDAKQALQKFNVDRELKSLPPALRDIIVNMPAGGQSWNGSVSISRMDKDDCITLRNGDELIGKLQNAKYEFETSFGKISLEPSKVAGMILPSEDDSSMLMILNDGQVITGKLLNTPIKLKLSNGDEVTPPITGKNGIRSVAYATKDQNVVESKYVMLSKRNSEQLLFDPTNVDWSFDTEYGTIKLSPSDMQCLTMTVQEGGLNKVTFKNGSVLSGLLASKELTLKLELGLDMKISRSSISQIVFQQSKPQALANAMTMTLRNEDTLIGKMTTESIKVKTSSGKLTINTKLIADMQFVPNQLNAVNIKLHDGTSIGGQVDESSLKFRVDPGPEISVAIGHIVKFTNPAKPEEPKAAETPSSADSQPTSQPATKFPAGEETDATTKIAHPKMMIVAPPTK